MKVGSADDDVVANNELAGRADETPDITDDVIKPVLGPRAEMRVGVCTSFGAADNIGSGSTAISSSTGQLTRIDGVDHGGGGSGGAGVTGGAGMSGGSEASNGLGARRGAVGDITGSW